MEEALIRKLMASLRCGVCKQGYQEDNIRVRNRFEDVWFMDAFCPSCHNRGLVVAVVEQGQEPGVITDLTAAESDKFRNRGNVTADDMLDMHCFLQDFDGDFSRFFKAGEA